MQLLRIAIRNPRRLIDLKRWLCSRLPWHDSLRDGEPWVTYGAREWLERTLDPSTRVFEFGSGGSTLYFARRVASVVAVEHDPAWAHTVTAAIPAEANAVVVLEAPEPVRDGVPVDPHYQSEAIPERSFERYARSIERFPDGSFDLVVIDGRARCGCARHALAKVRPGGHILLDNAERSVYGPIHELFAGYGKTSYAGPWPYGSCIGETVIWHINAVADS
jgi:SAM-dependent methyltransferase